MGLINLISGSDIESARVSENILSELNRNSNFIYITATLSLKEIRQEQFKTDCILKSFSHNDDTTLIPNLFTFSEFQKWTSYKIYKEQNYISTADQKFVLSSLIEIDCTFDRTTKKAMQNMKHELFELYKFLLFYEKKNIPTDILDKIEKNFSITEKNIFCLYNSFRTVLTKLVNGLRDGNLEAQDIDDSIIHLFKRADVKPNIDLYLNKVKTLMDDTLKIAESVFMDGFLFFDDLQKHVISSSVKQGKKVNLIAKYSVTDQTNSFLFEDNYYKLSQELGHQITLPYIDDSEFEDDTALNYIKMKYPHIDMRISNDVKSKLEDGSILIVKPFPNRDKELQYIVSKVSELVKSECFIDERKIKDFLSNDVAIVLAVEKEKYEERLIALFKDVGVFIYKGDCTNCTLNTSDFCDVDTNSFEKIYYSKKEFLDLEIRYKDGSFLSFDQKYKFFSTMFKGIGIRKTPRPIASYPIGQFIFEIYNIITTGITIDGFKMILYSNWHYNVNKSSIKWDRFISQFKNIQVFFEDLKSIEQWNKQVEQILLLKYEIENDPLYKLHPFNHVDTEFILFFSNILAELSIITNSIKDIEGSIEEHIKELKNKIMDADRILDIEQRDLNFEQQIIKKFCNAIEQIGNNSLVNGLDASYFSENLKGMLTDWEKEQLEEGCSDIKINVVNLENMHKFKHAFFMMLESDKYPRKYKYEFPFTVEILQIMDEAAYGINKHPAEIHGVDYHLKLEQYLFKNVLDFTKEKLFISYTEKEDKNTNKPSIFIEDIVSMFDTNIEDLYVPNELSSNINSEFNINTNKSINLPKKSSYLISEIGTFKLCPRLYFHLHYNNQDKHITYINRFQLRFYCEAVLYCFLLDRFKEYNEANHMIYSSHNDEYYFVLKSLLEESYSQVIKYFNFLKEYEIKDIKIRVLNKAVNFITSTVINYSKFNEFRVVNCNCKSQSNSNYKYKFEFENDILITNFTNSIPRRYQNNRYLDFTVQKTGEEINSDSIKDMTRIIECLDSNNSNIDRINLLSSLIHQFNVYFKSNYMSAIKIAESIEVTDFLQSEIKKSGFCQYCMLSEICKGNHYVSKGDY